jgi:hypothetical protein
MSEEGKDVRAGWDHATAVDGGAKELVAFREGAAPTGKRPAAAPEAGAGGVEVEATWPPACVLALGSRGRRVRGGAGAREGMGGRDLGAVGRARGNLRCDVAHLRESVGGGEGGWRVAPWPVMVARGWWEGEGGKKEA